MIVVSHYLTGTYLYVIQLTLFTYQHNLQPYVWPQYYYFYTQYIIIVYTIIIIIISVCTHSSIPQQYAWYA